MILSWRSFGTAVRVVGRVCAFILSHLTAKKLYRASPFRGEKGRDGETGGVRESPNKESKQAHCPVPSGVWANRPPGRPAKRGGEGMGGEGRGARVCVGLVERRAGAASLLVLRLLFYGTIPHHLVGLKIW